MSRRWPTGRSHEEDPPASPEFSRLLVLAFLIAGALGLLSGVAWLVYLWVTRVLGGQ
jgi:hypothetical protein